MRIIKNFLFLLFVVGLVSCNREKSKKLGENKTLVNHDYVVTFAAVKIPNEVLARYGDIKKILNDIPVRYRLSSYVLAHSGDFSFTTPSGNCLPIVENNHETRVKLLFDPILEEKDFKTLGIIMKRLDVYIRLQEENSTEQVACSWGCEFDVHMKEPTGNLTDEGGSRCAGYMLKVGQPDMTLLTTGSGASIWMLVALNRK